jgi:hypothetical protein
VKKITHFRIGNRLSAISESLYGNYLTIKRNKLKSLYLLQKRRTCKNKHLPVRYRPSVGSVHRPAAPLRASTKSDKIDERKRQSV